MNKHKLGAALAATLAAAACITPAVATPPTARDSALSAGAGAFEADLDRLLAAHDYATIETRVVGALGAPDDALRQRTVNWLALKQSHGETDSVFIAQYYTIGLMAQAVHAQGPARAQWINNAVGAYDRTFIVLLSEAGQCRDPIATDARLGQVAQTLAPMRAILPKLSSADRNNAARLAVVLATLTFRTRYPDDWLCRPRGAGPAAFRPYAAWSLGYDAAFQAAAKGMMEGGPPPAPRPPFLLHKDPKIVPLYQ
jgi:hypothetical protein